jgi:hypothetical protein
METFKSELSRLCSETSTKLYVHEFGLRKNSIQRPRPLLAPPADKHADPYTDNLEAFSPFKTPYLRLSLSSSISGGAFYPAVIKSKYFVFSKK